MITKSRLKLQTTGVFRQIKKAKNKKIIVLQGGSRTSKTWSVLQYFIELAWHFDEHPLTFRCGRQKMTWTKETILQDWDDMVNIYNLPIYPRHVNKNRDDQTYILNGHKFSFIGLDDPQKLHGMKQSYFWINEAVEAKRDDFDQLEQRTDFQGILDYNPKYERHWIYDHVKPRPDIGYIHSKLIEVDEDGTMWKTNPFVSNKIVNKILSYEPTETNRINGTADKNKWKIYGLGEPASIEGLIFDNVDYTQSFPDDCRWVVYGIDFGYSNDPTALIRVGYKDGQIYLDEVFYRRGLTSNDIGNLLDLNGLTSRDVIWADSASPMTIEELKRQGWNIKGARKGHDSIVEGIDFMKQYKLLITEKSMNFKVELENYTWTYEEKEDKFVNVPIDDFNDCWDAARYAITMKMKKRKPTYHGAA